MITKAIVEELITPYQVKVRIPLFDKTNLSVAARDDEELNVATICSLPNCYVNLQVGDIVFVAFEDNTYYKAVILGHLCRSTASDTCADIMLSSLNVRSSATLPFDTTVGDITSKELNSLQGVTENIQKQINNINTKLDMLIENLYTTEGS